MRLSRRASLAALSALAALGVSQIACENLRESQGKKYEQEAAAVQPALFTVTHDQLAHLQIVAVGRQSWQSAVHTTGTVDWDADRTTQAITQVNGPISRILVDFGTHVKKGDPLLYVSSPDVVNALSAYRKARNRQVFNQRVVNRAKELLDHGAAAQKDYESAEADLNDALTDVQNSLQPLKIFGITAAEIDQAEKQGTPIAPELPVRSPIDGVVVQKLISPGQVIQAGQTACFTISDVSRVWVQGHIFDRDLPAVRAGDPVEETNPSFSERFAGKISYIGTFVDPATRTTQVRIVTENPRGLLKKDMFVDAVIHTGTENNVLTVPVAAILRDDKNEPMVYIESQPGQFAQRPVTIAGQQNGMVQVTAGLREGERVVADGSVFLQFSGAMQ